MSSAAGRGGAGSGAALPTTEPSPASLTAPVPAPAIGGAKTAATSRNLHTQHAQDAYNKRLDVAVGKLNEHYINIIKAAKASPPPRFWLDS